MTKRSRREFFGTLAQAAGAATFSGVFPTSIERALAVPAYRRTKTIKDIEHIVILTQENRSFDHYFGTFSGVRGFADPFPIPVPDSPGIHRKTIWYQPNASLSPTQPAVSAFHLNTEQHFEYMRVEGTPHSWQDAQHAWNHGKMNRWSQVKRNHSMGYYAKEDIPYQRALANAFTICDAYHCAVHAGTNPNRLFIWTGTNDPLALGNGPATYNDYDSFEADPGEHGGYSLITYAERLERAGVSWQVYQNMEDNFTDNPLAGFSSFRDAWAERPGYSKALRDRGVSTRDLDLLQQDVLSDRLPQVSWVVSTAEGSEHPGPSSPAQGAAYTARVLDALTANPEVWSKTVLLVNFDENDGFFDHMPPPAPPSYVSWDPEPTQAVLAGASTVATSGEYHDNLVSYRNSSAEQALQHRPYGLGPRVPLYIISPWSKGGWVNSQVFDHTSVIRFLETRFGVHEPNLSAWRRAVCGDLTSAFDFSAADNVPCILPATRERAERARNLINRTTPHIPAGITFPVQEGGVRPSRALPYELHVLSRIKSRFVIELEFANTGAAAAVFHVYDRLRLDDIPRRYTVEASKSLIATWAAAAGGSYDLWVLGPNGFHRHVSGNSERIPNLEVRVSYEGSRNELGLWIGNTSDIAVPLSLTANKYYDPTPKRHLVNAQSSFMATLPLSNGPWYDFTVAAEEQDEFRRRFAGRMENGADSISDPAMEGVARSEQG